MKRAYGDGKRGLLPTALGQGSIGMSMVVLGMITYYLTTQTGLSGTVVGTILLASRVFDGVSDLIAGYIIDRSHFKLGKARPFDLFTIPMWIALVLCFAVPEWNTMGKIIYVFLMYNLSQTVCFTFKSVSSTVRMKRTFLADRRAAVLGAAGMCSAIFSTLAGILLPILIQNLEYQPHGWIMIALSFAIPGMIMSLSEFLLVPEMEPTEEEQNQKQVSFGEFAGELFHNKYLIMIIIITMASTLVNGIIGNVSTFFFKYVVGNLTAASIVGTVSIVGYLLLALLPVLTKRLGNRGTMMFAFGMLVVGNLAKYINHSSVGWLAVCTGVVTLGAAIGASVSSLVLIDTMHYAQLKSGTENEGVYSSIRGFADKVANGIAPFVVGRALDLGGFDGTLEVQSAGANNTIFVVYALIPAIIGLIGFVTMALCRMEQDIREMEASHEA